MELALPAFVFQAVKENKLMKAWKDVTDAVEKRQAILADYLHRPTVAT
jgi:hypothetical protein